MVLLFKYRNKKKRVPFNISPPHTLTSDYMYSGGFWVCILARIILYIPLYHCGIIG